MKVYPRHHYNREGKVRDLLYDIVIVDEVSMVDAPLMEELLRRIDFDKTRLILVGDHNQLPPVALVTSFVIVLNTELVPTFILDEVVRQAGVLKTNSTAILSQRLMPTAVTLPGASSNLPAESNAVRGLRRDLILSRIPDGLHHSR